jgi:hypothetical protein
MWVKLALLAAAERIARNIFSSQRATVYSHSV